MRKFLVFLFLSALIALTVADEIEEEEGVLVLDSDNFNQALQENDYILIEFYAPWCGHCKALAPEYTAAAAILVEENIPVKLAKIDATVHTELAQKFNVKGFPTLKLFAGHKIMDYSGGRDRASIVAWLKKRISPPAKTLTTVAEVEEFRKSASIVVIGYFESLDQSEAMSFDHIATEYLDAIEFAWTTEKSVAKKLGFKGDFGVIIYKTFDEESAVFEGEVTDDKLKSFVEANRYPYVTEITMQNAQDLVFRSDVHNFLIANSKADYFNEVLENFRTIAKKFGGKIRFILVDTETPTHEGLLAYFGVSKESAPLTIMSRLDGYALKKYKQAKPKMDPASVEKFANDVLNEKIQPYTNSEEIPEDEGPLKTLVGKNYDTIVKDPTKNVFVMIYEPKNCEKCTELMPIWEKVAEKYADEDDVIIGRLNIRLNEVENIQIPELPSFLLYEKDSTTSKLYAGNKTLEDFSEFLEKSRAGADAAEEGEEVEEFVPEIDPEKSVEEAHSEL